MSTSLAVGDDPKIDDKEPRGDDNDSGNESIKHLLTIHNNI